MMPATPITARSMLNRRGSGDSAEDLEAFRRKLMSLCSTQIADPAAQIRKQLPNVSTLRNVSDRAQSFRSLLIERDSLNANLWDCCIRLYLQFTTNMWKAECNKVHNASIRVWYTFTPLRPA